MAASEINIRQRAAALSWFRFTATKVLCLAHQTVEPITAVDSVATQGERTLYAVTLQCRCSRELSYNKVSTSGYQLVKQTKVELVEAEVEEAA
jgi:hypothetical protein